MNNDQINNFIVKEIEIDKNHITNFPLETEDGTKKLKERFHKNAVNEINKYIKKQQKTFLTYKNQIYYVLNERVEKLFPQDKTKNHDKKREELKELEQLVKYNNQYMTDTYKLGLDQLLSSIKENISLLELNKILETFINKMKKSGITLTIEDFKYTMFTEEYMKSFLNTKNSQDPNEATAKVFEEIYFKCPNIIIQLKNNLELILKKYTKSLHKYMTAITNDFIEKKKIDPEKIVDSYLIKRISLETGINQDEYYNLNAFLDKTRKIENYIENAPTRVKNYNQFAIGGDYNKLDTIGKEKYDEAVKDLYYTLQELKEYYRYEKIVKDLISKFKQKETIKTKYQEKQKELQKEEKERLKIYKTYIKATGKGIFAKENKEKMNVAMLKMNEQATKLNNLHHELKELEIIMILRNKLNDASSIYDLFAVSFLSYEYLEKQFIENFSEEENFHLEEEFSRYFRFLYNPYNAFLRQVNGLTDYNIASIISEKYKLLGLNIKKEDITEETIDATLETFAFIKLIQDIENTALSLENMQFIVKVKSITPEENWQNSYTEESEEII